MAPDNVAPGDRLAGEPDANDADVVEILAFQSGLAMPLTGLGRLAEGAGVVPPVLSATHVWITRGQSHDILEPRGVFLVCALCARGSRLTLTQDLGFIVVNTCAKSGVKP